MNLSSLKPKAQPHPPSAQDLSIIQKAWALDALDPLPQKTLHHGFKATKNEQTFLIKILNSEDYTHLHQLSELNDLKNTLQYHDFHVIADCKPPQRLETLYQKIDKHALKSCHDPCRIVTCRPWIEGEILSIKDLTPQHIQKIAKDIKKLHALNMDERCPIFEAPKHIQWPKPLHHPELQKILAFYENLKAPCDERAVFCHQDIQLAHLIWSDQVYWIDWECASHAHPIYAKLQACLSLSIEQGIFYPDIFERFADLLLPRHEPLLYHLGLILQHWLTWYLRSGLKETQTRLLITLHHYFIDHPSRKRQ